MTLPSTPEFTNLTHPAISAVWARRKSDGEAANRLLNWLYARPGLNWIPVFEGANSDHPNADARVPKRTACGPVREASVFTGAGNTKEYDWGLVVHPDNPRLVDTELLGRNAKRVVSLPFSIEKFDATKDFDLHRWYHDGSALLIETEVSAPMFLLRSAINPFPCLAGACQLKSSDFDGLSEPITTPEEVCAYGPWVQEALHGFRPEIHPVEAFYWRAPDGAWMLLMLQDASGRFDARNPGNWLTPKQESAENAEHWVQEAMLGQFVLPIDLLTKGVPTISLIGQSGLERIGANGFPSSSIDPGVTLVPNVDPRIQAAVVGTQDGRSALVIRAQIRGASHSTPLRNDGAYLLLRIASSGVDAGR